MKFLKMLAQKYDQWTHTPLGYAYVMSGALYIVSWLLHWESLQNFSGALVGVMLMSFMAYGVAKFIIWLTKEFASLIADEFRFYVRKLVREELKNLSRI